MAVNGGRKVSWSTAFLYTHFGDWSYPDEEKLITYCPARELAISQSNFEGRGTELQAHPRPAIGLKAGDEYVSSAMACYRLMSGANRRSPQLQNAEENGLERWSAVTRGT
jgi:hypothetical protein